MVYVIDREGEIYPIEEQVTIGRSRENDIVIKNVYTSRKHALIYKKDEGYLVKDLGSKYGTYVNGERVMEKELKEGDRIRIGTEVLLFSSKPLRIEKDEKPITDALNILHTIPSDPVIDEIKELLGRGVKNFRKLENEKWKYQLLYEISRMSMDSSEDEVVKLVLRRMIENLNAEFGVILLVDENLGMRFLTSIEREGNPVAERVSRTIATEVFHSGEPVLIEDAMSDKKWSVIDSVKDLKLRSVLCVPLKHENRVVGAIYLENRKLAGLFTEKELSLVDSITGEISNLIMESRRITYMKQMHRSIISSLREKYDFSQIVGSSPSLMEVLEKTGKVIASDCPVLITGESGTGKELIARAIHYNSKRAPFPFVAVNCAAIPENLIEGELFGYRKGSFTGAIRDYPGKIKEASKGTIFLDEISELPLHLQGKLLRVLQFGEITPIGGSAEKVDVRFIAATNTNLKELVDTNRFRRDLYYRINVVEIELPPLRERKEDIPHLVKHFIKKYSEQYGKRCKRISKASLVALMNYDFPGNIRELENIVERGVLFSDGEVVHLPDFEDFHGSTLKEVSAHIKKKSKKSDPRRAFIIQTLEENKWNISASAKALGISRRHLYRLMKQMEIKKGEE